MVHLPVLKVVRLTESKYGDKINNIPTRYQTKNDTSPPSSNLNDPPWRKYSNDYKTKLYVLLNNTKYIQVCVYKILDTLNSMYNS